MMKVVVRAMTRRNKIDKALYNVGVTDRYGLRVLVVATHELVLGRPRARWKGNGEMEMEMVQRREKRRVEGMKKEGKAGEAMSYELR